MNFSDYQNQPFFDELVDSENAPREVSKLLFEKLSSIPPEVTLLKQNSAQAQLTKMGVTFRTYQEDVDLEQTIPFDIIPRLIKGKEWDNINAGLTQRLKALNAFIDDVYHDQNVIKDGILPQWVLDNAKGFLPECVGLNPPGKIWSHICGTDLIRDDNGKLLVLEDNLRVPSGISYVLLNRELMKRNFPEVFQKNNVRQLMDFPVQFKGVMNSLMPQVKNPTMAILTPGIFNSAYFEHSWLAQKLGAYLVEGSDLVYEDGFVCMRTTSGLKKIDILYRRVDDQYIDPDVFFKHSTLGCPGMMEALKKGNLAIINTPGTGVADDKVVYKFVPDMIRYYLNEEPILSNVETYLCADPDELKYTLDNLESLVVKPAAESGGYGMLVGPQSTKKEIEEFRKVLLSNPSNYISQPTISLSTVPTLFENSIEPRHVDLRPFILLGQGKSHVMSGGLTRVALKKGSLVVNSSQGGGTKDTWIVDSEEEGVKC